MQRLSFKAIKWLVILIAVLQLALSQIHIKAISIMFARELGFYLFLFILFGLLLVFLLTSLKTIDGSSIFKIVFASLIASGSAGYCIYLMWSDYKANEIITLNGFKNSMILLIVGIGVYIIGNLLLLLHGLIDRKEAES